MSFASPYPDVEIPTASVYDYLFGSLEDDDADRIALVDTKTGTQFTYREMVERIDGFAAALAGRGIGAGDVVGVLLPNSSWFAFAFHGTLRAGAAATTINVLFTAKDIAKQLTDSKATMLVTATQFLPQAEEAAATVNLPADAVIVLDGEGVATTGHPNGEDLLAPRAAAPQVGFDPATHLAVLPYSSGTTGNPKGVMLTHRNLVANVAQTHPVQDVVAQDVVIAIMPFFHIYGMTVLLNAVLRARARLVMMPSFDLEEFLANIANHKVTVAYIAPPVAVALAKHPLVDRYDVSTLRGVLSGAAPLDEDLGHAVADRIGCRVVQGYGMTELSPVSHCTPLDGGRRLLGSVAPIGAAGWTVANSASRLIDPDTGDEIDIPASGLSEAGELWFKGPNVMAGYLGNEEATRETIDADGWLRTGDMARVDSTGCVYIVDRLKELIKYKGYQVPPAELEAVLLTHPAIADAAVVGVRDAESGEEVPKAFVVKQSGADLSEVEVMEFVAAEVAPYKKVRQVAFIDAIPKSSSGKILRKDLRDVSAAK
jgi:acyl-CoA synthetase (AMP-forming)/AMP-acid ligase II